MIEQCENLQKEIEGCQYVVFQQFLLKFVENKNFRF